MRIRKERRAWRAIAGMAASIVGGLLAWGLIGLAVWGIASLTGWGFVIGLGIGLAALVGALRACFGSLG